MFFDHKEFTDEDDELSNSFSGFSGGDGVVFSKNGQDWFKAKGLTSAESISSSYKEFYVDLDSVATLNGVDLTGNFYIKFLHLGDGAVPSQGFAFDNIRLTSKMNKAWTDITPRSALCSACATNATT